jgi:hypothetical protein
VGVSVIDREGHAGAAAPAHAQAGDGRGAELGASGHAVRRDAFNATHSAQSMHFMHLVHRKRARCCVALGGPVEDEVKEVSEEQEQPAMHLPAAAPRAPQAAPPASPARTAGGDGEGSLHPRSDCRFSWRGRGCGCARVARVVDKDVALDRVRVALKEGQHLPFLSFRSGTPWG